MDFNLNISQIQTTEHNFKESVIMAIKIEMLRCFATVAQTGNLAEAATRLYRTQSAVSMTLKQLEENLGQRLFESDRKNRLTPLGEQVFELAQNQLRQFDNSIKAIEAAAKSPKGLIRIASIPSVAGLVFPKATEALTAQNPGLRVDLRDTDTQQVIDAMLRGQADIGIVSGLHKLNGIRQAHLFSDQFGLICSPEHPLATQAHDPTIQQVASAGFVNNNLCSLIETPEFQKATAESRIAMHNTMSLIAMVRTNNWVTVLPQTVARFMSRDLVFRRITGLPDERHVSLLLRERTPYLKFAEEFWEFLINFDWAKT